MHCAGACSLRKPGRLAGKPQGRCLHATFRRPPSFLVVSRSPSPHARGVLQCAAAAPSQPGGQEPPIGVVAWSLSGSDGASETNGTPASLAAKGVPASAASSSGAASSSASSEAGDNGGPAIVTVSARSSFRSIIRRTYVGELLFMVIGALISGALSQWTVGTPLRRFNPYSFQLTLPQAPGVVLGTPLRMKGVPMGSVLSTTPMLDRVIVEVEVNEVRTIIPRDSKFELTQSGLIPAASIDISPPEGVSAELLLSIVAARVAGAGSSTSGVDAGSGEVSKDGGGGATGSAAAGRSNRPTTVRLASPKDVDACRLQGVLVCNGDQLDGLQGGSMDELMAHMLKTLRQGEVVGNGSVPGRGPTQG